MLKWRVSSPGLPTSVNNSSEDDLSSVYSDSTGLNAPKAKRNNKINTNIASNSTDSSFRMQSSNGKRSRMSAYECNPAEENISHLNRLKMDIKEDGGSSSNSSLFNSDDFSILSRSDTDVTRNNSKDDLNDLDQLSNKCFEIKIENSGSQNHENEKNDEGIKDLDEKVCDDSSVRIRSAQDSKRFENGPETIVRTNAIAKPPRKSRNKTVAVDVHSDNRINYLIEQRNESYGNSKHSFKSSKVTSFPSKNFDSLYCSSSEDSLPGRRTSIASGFTNLVIEAAFEKIVTNDLKTNCINGSEYDIKESFEKNAKKADVVLVSNGSQNLLTVSGNDTDDNIYSEACMIFGSESTIYERMHGSLNQLNRSNYRKHFTNYCDSKFNFTLPHSHKENIYDEPSRNVDRISQNKVDKSLSTDSTDSSEMEDIKKKSEMYNGDKNAVKSDPCSSNIHPRSKSADNLICEESSSKNTVTFDDKVNKDHIHRGKCASTWDKLNFTGSLGKRRSKFIDNIFKFSSETQSRSKSVDSTNDSVSTKTDLQSKRSSSESQLLDSPRVENCIDNLSDVSNGKGNRNETVNSSFRQRLTKFFQDCPKYPSITRSKQHINCDQYQSSRKRTETNESKHSNTSSTLWPFQVQLSKMRNVLRSTSGDQVTENINEAGTSQNCSKNPCKKGQQLKVQKETAKFYIDSYKSSIDQRKTEPLHNVQFFRSPQLKPKPPDESLRKNSYRYSIRNFEDILNYGNSKEYVTMPIDHRYQDEFETENDCSFYEDVNLSSSECSLPSTCKPALNYEVVSVETVIPMPRTIFHRRISPVLILREENSSLFYPNPTPFSRAINHTIPKRNIARPSSGIYYDLVDLSASTTYGYEEGSSIENVSGRNSLERLDSIESGTIQKNIERILEEARLASMGGESSMLSVSIYTCNSILIYELAFNEALSLCSFHYSYIRFMYHKLI